MDMSTLTTGSNSNGDKELERIFRGADDPVLTAPEVADKLGITQQAAYARLSQAAERDELERKKVGSRAVVWWLSNHASDDVSR